MGLESTGWSILNSVAPLNHFRRVGACLCFAGEAKAQGLGYRIRCTIQ